MEHDDRVHEDRVIRLAEMVSDKGTLNGYTFIGCHIKGPAVVYLRNSVVMQCQMGNAGTAALLWEIPTERGPVVGAVLADSCHFERCSFDNIGFTGPPAVIEALRASLD